MNLASVLLLLGLLALTVLAIRANLNPKQKPSCHQCDGDCSRCKKS